MWWIQDADGITRAGPFATQTDIAIWMHTHPGRGEILFAVDLESPPLTPVITQKMTESLRSLEETGDVMCVKMRDGRIAVYSL